MRSMLTVALVVALTSVAAQAAMELYDDFDSYTLGSVHGQGDDVVTGDRWTVQRNSSALGDPGWVTVVEVVGDQMLQIINRDTGGELDTIYACMAMNMTEIAAEGTIYVRFKANGTNDTIMATNDLWSGWDYDGFETGTAAAPSFQKTATNYNEMGAMVFLRSGLFKARDGSWANPNPETAGDGYLETDIGQQADVWQELWIQIDQTNDREKFYWCEDGGTPTLVANPGGSDWWYMRNEARDNDAVWNLKFFIGNMPTETVVTIESIAIDTSAMNTDRYAGWALAPVDGPTLQADFDGDGDVDLDDFVILKTNFGVVPPANGDADGDGDVDLDDFVILKNEFGS